MSKTFKLIPGQAQHGVIPVEIDSQVATRQSLFIEEFVSMDDESKDDGEILIEKADYKSLQKVVEFMTKYDTLTKGLTDKEKEEKYSIPKPLKSNDLKDCVGEGFAKFIDLPLEDVVSIMLTSNFMQVKPLTELCCAKVAAIIQSKPISEVKKEFGIIGEFTKEEFEEVEKQYPFLKESS